MREFPLRGIFVVDGFTMTLDLPVSLPRVLQEAGIVNPNYSNIMVGGSEVSAGTVFKFGTVISTNVGSKIQDFGGTANTGLAGKSRASQS